MYNGIDRKEVLKELIDSNGNHNCLDTGYDSVSVTAYIDNGSDTMFYSNNGKSYDISELNLGILSGYNDLGMKEFI